MKAWHVGVGAGLVLVIYYTGRIAFGKYTIPYTLVQQDTDEAIFDVDAVFTWVDSTDKNWQRKLMHEKNKTGHKADDVRRVRFPHPKYVDSELRRSVALANKNMPWLRHIYIVVARPQHCNWWANYTKVRVVYHDELTDFGLPMFSGRAIETILHKIPNLSEHFIYFNDDFYVLKPAPKSLFFEASGSFYSIVEIMLVQPSSEAYYRAHKKLARMLGYPVKLFRAHVPLAMTKTLVKKTMRKWPEWTKRTTLSPFRSPHDLPLLDAAVNLNARVLAHPPQNAYITCSKVTASALKSLTFAGINNCATESDYRKLERALPLPID